MTTKSPIITQDNKQKNISNKNQVLIIGEGGKITSTHLRKGKKGIDITKMGKCSIHRACDIIFPEGYQKWAIGILEGEEQGSFVTKEIWKRYVTTEYDQPLFFLDLDNEEFNYMVALTYEDAVELETFFLNHYRVNQ